MYKIINNILIKTYSNYIHNKAQNNIYQRQCNTFAAIIKNTAQTKFGKHYNITPHTTYEQYTKIVPIQNYEQYKSWITEAQEAADIIRPGRITKFSASSGTTSAKKHIPVSQEALDSTYKAGKDMISMYFSHHANINPWNTYYRPLWWSIQAVINEHTRIGDISAHMIQNTPKRSKKYLFDENVLLIPDRHIKRDTFANTIDTNKKIIILWVTSWIYEMIQYLHDHHPDKAQQLRKNLQGIVRWWVSVEPFMQQFKQRGITNHIGIYNASEWYFGYQDIHNFDNSEGQAPYILTSNHGIFYELVAVNDTNIDTQWNIKNTAQAIPVREVTTDHIHNKQKFALILTSNAGLYRYVLGDVIRFIDLQGHFVIEGRTAQSLNLKGEELMMQHTDTAIRQANQHFNLHIKYYTIAPDTQDNPSKHSRVVEWLDDKQKTERIHYIDQQLQELNADYKAKRHADILLKLPDIQCVPTDTFHKRLHNHNKLGAQNKIPKLRNDRKLIDEILTLSSQ